MVALMGVLLLGILNGVLVAVVVSLMMLLRAAARPHVAVLGRIPGSDRYSDLERHPDNEAVDASKTSEAAGSRRMNRIVLR